MMLAPRAAASERSELMFSDGEDSWESHFDFALCYRHDVAEGQPYDEQLDDHAVSGGVSFASAACDDDAVCALIVDQVERVSRRAVVPSSRYS